MCKKKKSSKLRTNFFFVLTLQIRARVRQQFPRFPSPIQFQPQFRLAVERFQYLPLRFWLVKLQSNLPEVILFQKWSKPVPIQLFVNLLLSQPTDYSTNSTLERNQRLHRICRNFKGFTQFAAEVLCSWAKSWADWIIWSGLHFRRES